MTVNQSKRNDPRFWNKWRNAGAVGNMQTARERQTRENWIKDNLTRKLEAYQLADRIRFSSSALDELKRVSDGDWKIAEVYAAPAVLDALQNRRSTITGKDIKGIVPAEALQLMMGGLDIWKDVEYIGTQVPDAEPIGVELRRMLSLWDADRNKDSMGAVREGRLPKYALTDRIVYEESGIMGPSVNVPFRYTPSKEDILAVAESLARFVSEHTGDQQNVRDISRPEMGDFGAQFVVQTDDGGEQDLLNGLNYRVARGFGGSYMEDVQGTVAITRERSCIHDERTLGNYVESVRV